MTTSLRPPLSYDDPGALIAAVPSMLSFHPTDSIVLLTYTGEDRLRLESVLRMDLPLPEHVADVAAQLRMVAANHEACVVELIVLGGAGADPPIRLPYRNLVEYLDDLFEQDGIALAHAAWSPTTRHGATWWCYEDPECTGQVGTAPAAPFATRDDMTRLLAPDPDEVLAPRAAALSIEPDTVDVEPTYRFVIDTIDQLDTAASVDPTLGAPAPLDDPTIVRLARALSTAEIREACLAMPLTHRAAAAEHLWLILTRAIPGHARAHPASLLAVSAYLRGEGTLASMAVDTALAANPAHHLTNTLRHALDCGIPPTQFRAMLANSLVRALVDPQCGPSR
jgi:hypothetical protein